MDHTFIVWIFVKKGAEVLATYTPGDSDVISSYRRLSMSAMMWGKLWAMFVIVTSRS